MQNLVHLLITAIIYIAIIRIRVVSVNYLFQFYRKIFSFSSISMQFCEFLLKNPFNISHSLKKFTYITLKLY